MLFFFLFFQTFLGVVLLGAWKRKTPHTRARVCTEAKNVKSDENGENDENNGKE